MVSRFWVKSAGWTDDLFLRDTPSSNETQVQYVKDMNLNSIRFENIWGNSQNIYDLCDRYGLMALGWVELPLGVGTLSGLCL